MENVFISVKISHTAQYGIWAPFEAAHIFPLEYENIWIEHNYGRRITDTDDAVDISKINSVQNGLLMDGGLNILLNQYIFSVNPDDGYKIVSFMRILDSMAEYLILFVMIRKIPIEFQLKS
ncbi:hypothetical protein I7I53_02182 [Histoplasma capsulatum var. duboisii H88]|uniref:HNH nuclease domain-containing protein n=1 Tax=Ajellomyces capsulatus (strain H88) TaxID=544711 RepID=A0A8A1LJS3_AJEC8|nr:hypothetical protein I7I53_02182 [Histoplasma capsulatum var. duboisii H88]